MIFVDTGEILARVLAKDEHHAPPTRGFERIAKERIPVLTTSHVLDEVITLLGRWAGHGFAALAHFERFADQRVSFTDCLSFVKNR